MRYRFLSLVLFLVIPVSLLGQTPELRFNHFRTDDGLSHNSVYSINQDTIGFMWIGTRSGLNRFDGNRFKYYGIREGLKDVYVNKIFRDSEGNMWIGTQEGGLSRYNYEKDDFITWMIDSENEEGGRKDNVLAIGEDLHGGIWIGLHNGGLFRFSREDETLHKVEMVGDFSNPQVRDRINAIAFDSDSTAWLGTFHGLFRIILSDSDTSASCYSKSISGHWITSIYLDENRSLFAGTDSGLLCLDPHTGVMELFSTSNSTIPANMITDIDPISREKLLVSSDGGGISIYNKVTGAFENYQSDPNSSSSLSNNSVYDVFQSNDGALWIGNYLGGINYYSAEEWKFNLFRHNLNDLNSLSDNQVRTLFEDPKGNIWIGTLGGLNFFDRFNGNFKSFHVDRAIDNSLISNSVLAINQIDNNLLWIGTFGGGVNILDTRNNSYSKLSHPDDLNKSLERASIYQIEKTDDGRMILASLGGIYLFDMKSGKMQRFTSSNSTLSSNTVKVMCIDHNGNIWLGTNYGLNRFNLRDTTFTVFTHSPSNLNSLSNNRILSIYESNDEKIWVGTEGGGVSIFDPATEQFTTLSTEQGFPDNVINAIVQDRAGIFWLTSNKGLIRYEQSTSVISVYSVADGLQGNEFYQNSFLLAYDGTLYFGGPNGFNSFNPKTLRSNPHTPKVVLTDLYHAGKLESSFESKGPVDRQICLADEARFPYHSSFEIHFSVPGAPNSNKYKYSYFLEGAGQSWTAYQKTTYANFSNLRPGNYLFQVRAMNNDGIVSHRPASIKLKILPPWWKSWWAFFIYAVIIGGLLMVLLYLNDAKLKVRHAWQMEVKEKEHMELLNQMKFRFFTDISHEFKTPLTLILGHLDNIRDSSEFSRNKTLGIIESNAKRLLTLINQLMEFRKAESGLSKLHATKGSLMTLVSVIANSFSDLASRKNISFEVAFDKHVPEVWFDAEKMEKIIYNLLSNAFKYTDEGGEVKIELKTAPGKNEKASPYGDNQILLLVKDSGIGIPEEQIPWVFERFYHNESQERLHGRTDGSGIGLALSKRLVELHHGSISVSSTRREGTIFEVCLPIGKDHLSDEEIREDNQYHLRLDYSNLTPAMSDSDEGNEPGVIIDESKPIMLVVDDNKAVCQLISEKFQKNFTVITAGDGKKGIQKARQYLPDVIISDIMMPHMNGYEFCRLLKSTMSTSHIPVLLLTAKSSDEDQINGYNTGADAYMAKPYNPELLRATILNLVNSRKLLQKKYIDQLNFADTSLIENRLDEEFLRNLVKTIENEEFSEKVDVATLCSELAMSRSVLYRKVKMLTDHSIQEFIRLTKLKKSARLLISTNLPISEIAYQCGFSNTKHFSTTFKKHFHKTPSTYRKSKSLEV